MSQTSRGHISGMIKAVLKITLSALVIWYLVSQSNPEQLIHNIMTVDPWGLALAVLIMNILPAVQALRWCFIIRAIGANIRYTDAFINVLIGVSFNQILPSSIGGDAVRMWRTYRLGLGVIPTVHSVMLDRLTALLALILIVCAGIPVMFLFLGDRPERWAVPILASGVLIAFVFLFLFDRIPGRFMTWRPLVAIAKLSADARRVMLCLSSAAPVIGLSVIIHISSALVVYIIAQSMALPVDVLDCLILVPPVILLSVLPISIAGWGVREGAMLTAFGLIGLGYDEAFALSVLFGLVIMATGVPGGILWLFHGTARANHKDSINLPLDAPNHREPSGTDNLA